jgi:hypothetical protein
MTYQLGNTLSVTTIVCFLTDIKIPPHSPLNYLPPHANNNNTSTRKYLSVTTIVFAYWHITITLHYPLKYPATSTHLVTIGLSILGLTSQIATHTYDLILLLLALIHPHLSKTWLIYPPDTSQELSATTHPISLQYTTAVLAYFYIFIEAWIKCRPRIIVLLGTAQSKLIPLMMCFMVNCCIVNKYKYCTMWFPPHGTVL